MTRTSRSIPLLVLMLVAVLAIGACGSSSTPAATSGSSATPAATSGGGETAAPAGETPAPAGETPAPAASGPVDISAAAAGLENLDNYSFRIDMKAEGGSEFMMVPSGGSLVMEGDVILKPTQAVDVTMTTSDGSTETAIGYRIIGDTAYINLGGESWMSAPADDAENAVDAFKPEAMLGSYSNLDGLAKVGEEEKNGIACEHYASTADPGIGDMFGLPGASWTSDVWIAKDGGYMVSAVMTATGKNASGKAGTFTLAVDVTGANDPNLVIEPPANVTELPS
jgi:hypothetical protein